MSVTKACNTDDCAKNYIVYKHTNKLNNKCYIGITSRKPETRWNNGKGYLKCTSFYRAIQKYGWNSFTHEILHTNLSQTEAEKIEIELIHLLQSNNPMYGYNICKGGRLSNGFSGHRHSEESKEKIKQSLKLNRKPISDKAREELRERMKGNTYGSREKTPEERRKLSAALKGRPPVGGKKVICLNTLEVFDTIAAAALKYGIKDQSTISKNCKGKRKSAGKNKFGEQLRWQYYADYEGGVFNHVE